MNNEAFLDETFMDIADFKMKLGFKKSESLYPAMSVTND